MRGVGSSVKSQTTQFVKQRLQSVSNIAYMRVATEENFFRQEQVEFLLQEWNIALH